MNKQNIKKIIEDRVNTFESSTPQQQRILIASDVIQRIKSHHYEATCGDWVEVIDYSGPEDGNLREELAKDNVICDVCALGGVMLSCVSFVNNVFIDHSGFYIEELQFIDIIEDSSNSGNQIFNYFSIQQLAMIEIAYELGCGYYQWDFDLTKDGKYTGLTMRAEDEMEYPLNMKAKEYIDSTIFDKCKNFAIGESPKERLLKIMNNIIDNNGTFTP